MEYDQYLKQHEGKSIQARRTAVLHPIAALQTLGRHAQLRQIFTVSRLLQIRQEVSYVAKVFADVGPFGFD